MKLKIVVLLILSAVATNSFGQKSVTEIRTQLGVSYIITTINYPIVGSYTFEGAEPIVTLNASGTGIYQLHDEPKRPMIWGIESNKEGEPKFKKGYDSTAYTLWYQFTDSTEKDAHTEWKSVELLVNFHKKKIYIQGERVKDFNSVVKKKD